MTRLLLLSLLVAAPSLAWAHGDAKTAAWLRELALLLPLFGVGLWYAIGYLRLRANSHTGISQHNRRALMFVLGWGTIAASLLTPLHEMGRHSFTAHMIEHELLMLVAAPLIALSRPIGVFMWALPHSTRLSLARTGHRPAVTSSWRFLTDPLVVTILQAIAMWAWHAPALFDRALQHEGWHTAQHLSFVFSALLFWWGITHAARAAHNYGIAAVYLFITALHTGLLGALMSFSASPWYAGYAAMSLGANPLGLSAVEDQQLAGLVMWIPGGVVHAGAALVYVTLWLRRMDDALENTHAVATK